MQKQVRVWGLLGTSALGIIFLAYLGGDVTSAADAAPNAAETVASAKSLAPIELECSDSKPASGAKKVTTGDPSVRASAQRGLTFLSHATDEWQERNKCFGCHVQGVTGEAFAVGLNNDYTLPENGMQNVLDGILTFNGSLRSAQGHAREGGHLRMSSRAFGGAALARYDALISESYSDDLLTAAQDLLEYQSENGDVTGAYNHGIVAQGDIQGTYQAIQTWKQAYERSADDRWLTAIQKAEKSLQRKIDPMLGNVVAPTQHINYAVLGLLEAGVGGTEATMVELRDRLLESQLEDGGWPAQLGNQGASSTLVTGQTLYTLRRLGMNDGDAAIQKGIAHLMKAQKEDGGWSDSGSEKAEAMWAVLGLVATDVVSVNVDGLTSGQHVHGQHDVSVLAADNEGQGVQKVEIFVDDIRVAGTCGDKLDWNWSAEGLETGKHLIDVVATNKKGNESRRRFTVYAGDVYVTGLGTRFENDGTRLTARNIAPKSFEHSVNVALFESKDDGKVGEKVFSTKIDGEQGPVNFHWDGKTSAGKAAEGGEYIARVTITDKAGKTRQTEEIPFVHATYEYQKSNYAQASGSIDFADDEVAANAEIELIDEEGNVVQRTRSTASGKWRFRNVKAKKKYRVRVKKQGFKAAEAPLAADKGEEAEMQLRLE